MSRNEFIKKAIEDYTQTVLKIAFSYTKNTSDVEDIAQDVFYALLREENVFSLEEKYRIPIHLLYYEGYSIREIAEILLR